jgi:hypothetical protein
MPAPIFSEFQKLSPIYRFYVMPRYGHLTQLYQGGKSAKSSSAVLDTSGKIDPYAFPGQENRPAPSTTGPAGKGVLGKRKIPPLIIPSSATLPRHTPARSTGENGGQSPTPISPEKKVHVPAPSVKPPKPSKAELDLSLDMQPFCVPEIKRMTHRVFLSCEESDILVFV